jgi:hypothetical protein
MSEREKAAYAEILELDVIRHARAELLPGKAEEILA